MFSLRIGPKVIKRMHCTKTEKISVKLPYSAYSWPIANFTVIPLIYFKIVHRVYVKTASLLYGILLLFRLPKDYVFLTAFKTAQTCACCGLL